MRLFDTNVQELKYKVLKEIVSLYNEDNLNEKLIDIPKVLVPGPKATMRCCIYKERAIIQERVKFALGKGENEDHVVEVLDIACDECPVQRFSVSNSCRGCVAHRCESVCPVGAISIVNQKATINTDKCIECGKCKNVCPYNAIIESQRPCVKGCPSKAITVGTNKIAKINYEQCIGCGNCVYLCPFGAIVDKSYILDALEIARNSKNKNDYNAYAIIAPAIVSQFSYAKIGQIVAGIKKIGFHDVVEVALGADITAVKDAKELNEKGFLTSSCCPSFVKLVKQSYPQLEKYISENPSPMVEIARYIKRTDKNAKVVFIGPCIAKKEEYKLPHIKDAVDCVITFEELQAMFDGLDIDVENLNEEPLDNASFYGRIFARSGGVTEAIKSVMPDINEDFVVKPQICNGAIECKLALVKAKMNKLDANFIEGMACEGGCINGAGCLHHGVKSKKEVDDYGSSSISKTINESLKVLTSLDDDIF